MRQDGPSFNHFHPDPSSSLSAVPVAGDMPAPQLRWSIIKKTGIPEFQWAAMYVPILAAVETIDEQYESDAAVSFQILDRKQLARDLAIDPAVSFGGQLYRQQRLTGPEAIFLDTDFFRNWQTWRVNFKIEADEISVCNLISTLEQEHLIERWWVIQRVATASFATVGTGRLTELLRALIPTGSTLLSLNGSLLYTGEYRRQ